MSKSSLGSYPNLLFEVFLLSMFGNMSFVFIFVQTVSLNFCFWQEIKKDKDLVRSQAERSRVLEAEVSSLDEVEAFKMSFRQTSHELDDVKKAFLGFKKHHDGEMDCLKTRAERAEKEANDLRLI